MLLFEFLVDTPVASLESGQMEASRLFDSTGAMFWLGLVVELVLLELSLSIDDVKTCTGAVRVVVAVLNTGECVQIDWNGVITCSKCHIKWSLVCTRAQLALVDELCIDLNCNWR